MPRCQVGYFISALPRRYTNPLCVSATEIFTRDCLSALKSFRTDIPADHYEGCRPASRDVKLAHYVNNSINELDIRRDYYDSVTWCFCFFDDRCNGAGSLVSSITMALSLSTIALLMGRL
ncbi:hypothetical protein B566_EDAN017640 [Ephemera danica]|nr:hypothetical protein B566_EDAN017640 [Ephemera danica]